MKFLSGLLCDPGKEKASAARALALLWGMSAVVAVWVGGDHFHVGELIAASLTALGLRTRQ